MNWIEATEFGEWSGEIWAAGSGEGEGGDREIKGGGWGRWKRKEVKGKVGQTEGEDGVDGRGMRGTGGRGGRRKGKDGRGEGEVEV
ncbi:unnamed protein product [Prunus armeniaca]|uniref:Uncharacterized protein n=1 Tax=Prunus armeniaca TaxID=36596 RepID=A0A6J5UX74_PRUAR|nr:unnamed protein product [Prunus armeniaca]CAB4311011.1 unnamed protein product [Prunus armeniaca]